MYSSATSDVYKRKGLRLFSPPPGSECEHATRALIAELEDGRSIADGIRQIRGAPAGGAAATDGGESVAAEVSNSGPVTIVWDAQDRRSALMARALRYELPQQLRFVEQHDAQAVADLCASHELPAAKVFRAGGLAAVLPDGAFLVGCEASQRVLFYELLYRKTLVPVPREVHERIEREYLAPLQARRVASPASAADSAATWWWQDKEALHLIGTMLGSEKFAVIDGFLPAADLAAMMAQARAVRGQMQRGIKQGGHGPYWGDERENEGDFLNAREEPRQWTIRGDSLFFARDGDARAPELPRYTRALDALIVGLQAGRGAGPGCCRQCCAAPARG
eukprot:NODE_3463_length_2032_cov_3.581627.p1 GENE.NODE_3463_length_2032_cov_3.581627~~NODE_3463_length_2032_cov_3.581627.p1  ORF type:complete len:336 (+),score=111.34 NODE_3463_length_2032_cov_3.581627:63-1070(+)